MFIFYITLDSSYTFNYLPQMQYTSCSSTCMSVSTINAPYSVKVAPPYSCPFDAITRKSIEHLRHIGPEGALVFSIILSVCPYYSRRCLRIPIKPTATTKPLLKVKAALSTQPSWPHATHSPAQSPSLLYVGKQECTHSLILKCFIRHRMSHGQIFSSTQNGCLVEICAMIVVLSQCNAQHLLCRINNTCCVTL